MTNTESAVSFAAMMIREGRYMGTAIRIAAAYYNVSYADVQSGLAARAGKSRKGRKQAVRPVRKCDNGCEADACWKLTISFGYSSKLAYYTCEKCGKHAPAHAEFGSGHEAHTDSKWTAYKPTKAVQGKAAA
jgi:hypothetical protein